MKGEADAGERLSRFVGLDLELVGVALLAAGLFVADLDEDDLQNSPKAAGGDRRPPPQRV